MIDGGCGTKVRSFPRRLAIIRLASIISTVKMLLHIQLIFYYIKGWTTYHFLFSNSVQMIVQKDNETRKSSCLNARGIPTATYQVLHLLPYPEGGVPTLAGERGTYLGGGWVPTLDGKEGTTLDGGGRSTYLWYPFPRVWTDWKHNLLSRTTYAVGNSVIQW